MNISVIIPSKDGFRGGNLELLKEQLVSQSLPLYEIITVIGVSPNGKARNVGVEKASGDYYVFIDDDVILGDETVIEKLIKPFTERNDIGMTGPSQLIPQKSNDFQKRTAFQIPRSIFPIQKRLVDSDMVSHMCLAMPAKLFKELGWENPEIISGTDPDLRYRVREAGFRVCVVPDCWAYHPIPESFWSLMRLAFEKGKNSAITAKTHPNLVFELDSGYREKFSPRRGLFFRAFRACGNFLRALFLFRIIYASYILAYSAGYAFGMGKSR